MNYLWNTVYQEYWRRC